MKKHLFNLLLFTVLVIGLSGCRTSAPKLDYKKLARASVRLGVDIGMEDNHKLYLEAAEWIGTPYRGGGETKRGTDCSGMTCQIYKKVYHTKLQRSTDGQKKESSKVARRNLREGDLDIGRQSTQITFIEIKNSLSLPKIPQMKYTVYLFDFDYTLADSSRGIVTCFRSVLERHGYTGITDDMIKRTIGKTLEESFSILTGITDADQLESFRQEYSKEADIYMNANTILFPDTLPTLTHLKKQGIRIGIISTKYRFRILSFLRNHMPDDWFDIIIGGEDVTHHKPDPEGLLLAIDRLKACPEEVLYIGDSTVDAGTAAAAGVSFTGVTSGMTTAQEFQAYPYDRIISTLGQLISVPEDKSGCPL